MMAIAYRHILRQWNTFATPRPVGRQKMMCSRRSLIKYSGVPGITEQPLVVNGRSGWCAECLVNTMKEIMNLDLPDVSEIKDVYGLVLDGCSNALEAIVELSGSKETTNLTHNR